MGYVRSGHGSAVKAHGARKGAVAVTGSGSSLRGNLMWTMMAIIAGCFVVAVIAGIGAVWLAVVVAKTDH